MKKSQIAIASLNALSIAGIVATMAPSTADATVSCTAGTVNTALSCTLATGDYIAQSAAFTGSVNVVIAVSENATGFGACGAHYQGTGNQFGLTTLGGSLETVNAALLASGSSPTANILSGGC